MEPTQPKLSTHAAAAVPTALNVGKLKQDALYNSGTVRVHGVCGIGRYEVMGEHRQKAVVRMAMATKFE